MYVIFFQKLKMIINMKWNLKASVRFQVFKYFDVLFLSFHNKCWMNRCNFEQRRELIAYDLYDCRERSCSFPSPTPHAATPLPTPAAAMQSSLPSPPGPANHSSRYLVAPHASPTTPSPSAHPGPPSISISKPHFFMVWGLNSRPQAGSS
jgi:hypothetical protein